MERSDIVRPLYAGGTIGQLMISAIERYAERPAIADDEIHYSYREFGEVVARTIGVLRRVGLAKGDALALLCGNRVDGFACRMAATLMGIRFTPLHPAAAEENHLFILDDAEIDALVVDDHYAAKGAVLREKCVRLKHFLSLGPVNGALDLPAAAATTAAEPLRDEADPQDIVSIAYTGGTTGRPKGAMLSHRSMIACFCHELSDWDLPDDMRYLAVTPISHASGSVIPIVLMRGGYTRLVQGFDAEQFCRIVQAERITMTWLVPTIVYVLLDHLAQHPSDLSSLQSIVYGAAPMSPDRLREALGMFGPVFVQLYGQTEAPMAITTLRKADHDPGRPERFGSIGLPCPAVQVKLFDADMKEVPPGTPGEICVRGGLVMSGYWKRADATEAAFRGDWLHTGDVAIRSTDGYFTIVDRTTDMIISGGFNVYPREVEDALLSHGAVSSTAVIGIPDAKWGESVKAFVVLRPGVSCDEATLQAHVKLHRGSVWVPKSIDFVSAIPVTALGKIDRKLLREPYWRGKARQIA
jgi:fatty-acyl-CoA synthase